MSALLNSPFHRDNTSKLVKLLPNWISLILIAVIAVMLASLFWLLMTPPEPLPTATVSKEKVKTSEPVVNYGPVVAKLHMFGWEKPKPKPVKAPPKVAPKPAPVVTKLDLKLFGIVARVDRPSFAIITKGKDAQKVYGVGEEPQKGVVIEEILPTKVMLRHGGKLEELLLPVKKLASRIQTVGIPETSKGSNPNLPVASEEDPRWGFKQKAPPPVVPPVEEDSLPIDDMSGLRDALTLNPDKLLEIASISEAKDKDGNLTGFRLSPGKNRKLFRSLGLRPGDIVTQVNGIALTDPTKGLLVMNELSSASSIAITVKRGDQEVTIEKQF